MGSSVMLSLEYWANSSLVESVRNTRMVPGGGAVGGLRVADFQ